MTFEKCPHCQKIDEEYSWALFQDLKHDASLRGWKATSRVRKLAGGPKRYIRITGALPRSGTTKVGTVRAFVQQFFPHAHMTSGGFGGRDDFDLTFAEFTSGEAT